MSRAGLSARSTTVAGKPVNALVEATPIACPAKVSAAAPASRAVDEVGTLTRPIVFAPSALTRGAARRGAGGLADFEMTIARPPASAFGSDRDNR